MDNNSKWVLAIGAAAVVYVLYKRNQPKKASFYGSGTSHGVSAGRNAIMVARNKARKK
jgi:hypothetical protein